MPFQHIPQGVQARPTAGGPLPLARSFDTAKTEEHASHLQHTAQTADTTHPDPDPHLHPSHAPSLTSPPSSPAKPTLNTSGAMYLYDPVSPVILYVVVAVRPIGVCICPCLSTGNRDLLKPKSATCESE